MIFSQTLLNAAILATVAIAAPTNFEERGSLEARLNSVTCKNQAFLYYPNNGRSYTSMNTITGTQISAALNNAPATLKNGEDNWGSGYPHQWQNIGKEIQGSCAGAVMLEFPVFQKGFFDPNKSKKQQAPEGFRIIYTETDKEFCGVISHDGKAGTAPVLAQKKNGKKPAVAAKDGTLGQTSVGLFHLCT